MSAPVSLQTAIANRGSTDFSNLGKGSLFSWKVEVLLYDPNTGWKFEKANTFQRVFWKIAKYVPFLKQYHAPVNMALISGELSKVIAPTSGLKNLIARVKEFSNQKIHSNLQNDVRKDSVDWTVPSINTVISITAINPQEPHGEVADVAEHLQISETSPNLAIIRYGKYDSPDVLHLTANKRVRIYEGKVVLNSQHIVYREYNSLDEAVTDYEKQRALASVCVPSLSDLFTLRDDCSRGRGVLNRYSLENLHARLSIKDIDPQVRKILNDVYDTLKYFDFEQEPPKALIEKLKPIVDSGITCLLSKINATYEPKAKNPERV